MEKNIILERNNRLPREHSIYDIVWKRTLFKNVIIACHVNIVDTILYGKEHYLRT